jgi:hypothetical protein
MAKELKKVPTLGGDLCDLPAVFHVYGTVRRGVVGAPSTSR